MRRAHVHHPAKFPPPAGVPARQNRPRTRRGLAGAPAAAAAGLAAAAVSLAADVVLATIGQAAFTASASFGKFSFATYALLTVLGVAGATPTWWAVTRLSSRPRFVIRDVKARRLNRNHAEVLVPKCGYVRSRPGRHPQSWWAGTPGPGNWT